MHARRRGAVSRSRKFVCKRTARQRQRVRGINTPPSQRAGVHIVISSCGAVWLHTAQAQQAAAAGMSRRAHSPIPPPREPKRDPYAPRPDERDGRPPMHMRRRSRSPPPRRPSPVYKRRRDERDDYYYRQ